MPHKPELVGIPADLPSAPSVGAYAGFYGVVRLGEDLEIPRGARETFVDLATFHHVADLALALPEAEQQKRSYESHAGPLLYIRISIHSSDNSQFLRASRTGPPGFDFM